MKNTAKKILCLVLMLTCLSWALADEEFTLRNGIVYGDTIDDILKKETTLVQDKDDSNTFRGKIAGYDGAYCTFFFDDDGKLNEMRYSFEDACTSRDKADEIYDKLKESLKRKYGTPLGNTGGSCHLITGSAISKMAIYVYLLGELDGYSGNYIDYDEWIVEADNYNVKIDLTSYYWRDSDFNYYYYVDVSYLRYTDQDLDDAINEKNKEQQEVDNDL